MHERDLRLTDYPLPPYTYVPGAAPHPLKEGGHGCVGPPQTHASQVLARFQEVWNESPAYLWGIDLFNHGFYWEAHEAWEEIWRQLSSQPAAADWCKGLIKLAAAGVKVREGRPIGVRSHARRAAQLFWEVQAQSSGSSFAGINPQELHRQALAVVAQFKGNVPDELLAKQKPAQPMIVFPFTLRIPSARS